MTVTRHRTENGLLGYRDVPFDAYYRGHPIIGGIFNWIIIVVVIATLSVYSILLITNMCDKAVNNEISWLLLSRWRARGLERFEGYEFGEEYHLIHDIIDPQQFDQQTALVYPTLLDLITRGKQHPQNG
jgi:uncharacterized metal-binding protein